MKSPRILDLTGVACPLNWARAKAVLESLAAGDVLTVVTDDPRALRDMPAAAEAEGWAVLEAANDHGTIRITIEK